MLKSIFSIIIVFFSITNSNVSAMQNDEQEFSIIQTLEKDITGDGYNEVIELKGNLFSDETNYYQDLWVDIRSEHNNLHWKISYGGGYKPTLKLIHLNNDDSNELLFQSIHHLEDKKFNYHLHTFKNNKIKKIELPKQWHINGKYKEDFYAELSLAHDKKSIEIDIAHLKDNYISDGIYDKNGKLLKQQKLIIEPITKIELLTINNSMEKSIESTQQVRSTKKDLLGTIKTLWLYENDKWIILKTKWLAK